jgi:hypothetical protein
MLTGTLCPKEKTSTGNNAESNKYRICIWMVSFTSLSEEFTSVFISMSLKVVLKNLFWKGFPTFNNTIILKNPNSSI